MVKVRFSHQIESSNLGRDDTDDLLKLTSNRFDLTATGGFFDNWNDTIPSQTDNSTSSPFKLHDYHVRVWTTGPCVLYSSDVEQYKMVDQGGSNDTSFNQLNIANRTIKKWTLCEQGRTWSHLGKDFVRYSSYFSKKMNKKMSKRVGRPRTYDNKQFKVQLKNIDPNSTPQDVAYYAIITGTLEYDLY